MPRHATSFTVYVQFLLYKIYMIVLYTCLQGIRKTHAEFLYDPILGINGTRALHAYSALMGSVEDDSTDCLGHGTHVAATFGGLQYGIAKNVTVHAGMLHHCLLIISSNTGAVSDCISMHLFAFTASFCQCSCRT